MKIKSEKEIRKILNTIKAGFGEVEDKAKLGRLGIGLNIQEMGLLAQDCHKELKTITLALARLVNPGDNFKPIANAGPVQNVAEGALVTLEGAGSSGIPEYQKMFYRWRQCRWSGLPVVLSDATVKAPTFTAPTGLEDDITLEFTLVVTSALGLQSHIDNTYVIVKSNTPPDLPAPVNWDIAAN